LQDQLQNTFFPHNDLLLSEVITQDQMQELEGHHALEHQIEP
jgi:hypothetical protein